MKNTVDSEWTELYGEVVSSDLTVECVHCGYTVYGDDPKAMVVCTTCWKKGLRDE